MDFTTVQDTARYTLTALRGAGLANQVLTVAGDCFSPAGMAETTGSRLEFPGLDGMSSARWPKRKRTATNP